MKRLIKKGPMIGGLIPVESASLVEYYIRAMKAHTGTTLCPRASTGSARSAPTGRALSHPPLGSGAARATEMECE